MSDIDAIFERMATDERDEFERKLGEHILKQVAAASKRYKPGEEDPMFELLGRAEQIRHEEAQKRYEQQEKKKQK